MSASARVFLFFLLLLPCIRKIFRGLVYLLAMPFPIGIQRDCSGSSYFTKIQYDVARAVQRQMRRITFFGMEWGSRGVFVFDLS